ncbi:MAG TPA: hypothetical protein VFS20_28335, partial [Longimicrobium sp.]|nr:hypothetical protein [Longimicrobium sp.]
DWDLDADVFDVVPGRSGGGGGGGSGPRGFGGGGGFSGGGAGGSWGGPAAPAPIPAAAPMGSSAGALRMQGLTGGAASSRGSGSGFKLGLPSLDLDDDSGVLIALILLVVAAVALVMAAGYIVIIAPALLAELVVDGIVVAGLYRRVREIDDARWLRTAVRKTWIPALVVALLLGGVGYGVQRALPEARSVGDVWRAAPSSERGDAETAP